MFCSAILLDLKMQCIILHTLRVRACVCLRVSICTSYAHTLTVHWILQQRGQFDNGDVYVAVDAVARCIHNFSLRFDCIVRKSKSTIQTPKSHTHLRGPIWIQRTNAFGIKIWVSQTVEYYDLLLLPRCCCSALVSKCAFWFNFISSPVSMPFGYISHSHCRPCTLAQTHTLNAFCSLLHSCSLLLLASQKV